MILKFPPSKIDNVSYIIEQALSGMSQTAVEQPHRHQKPLETIYFISYLKFHKVISFFGLSNVKRRLTPTSMPPDLPRRGL